MKFAWSWNRKIKKLPASATLNSTERMTRGVADPLNLRQKKARLELRRNFFSIRVMEHWIKVPYDLKRAKSVEAFKLSCRQYRKQNAESHRSTDARHEDQPGLLRVNYQVKQVTSK